MMRRYRAWSTARASAVADVGGASLPGRLVVVFGVFTLVLVAFGVLGIAGVQQSSRSSREITLHVSPGVDLNQRVGLATERLRDDALNARRQEQPGAPAIEIARNRLDADLIALPRVNDDPEFTALVEHQRAAIDAWMSGHVVPLRASPQDRTAADEAGEVASFAHVRTTNDAVTRWLQTERSRLREQGAKARNSALGAVGLGLLVAVAITLAGAFNTVRWISQPLADVVAGLDRLRQGDLDQEVPTAGPREVRLVGAAVNHLADQTALLRALRQESSRLRRGTLEGALAVREKIEWSEVLAAGLSAIGQTIDVDAVWFHPVQDGHVGECTDSWAQPTFAAVVDLDAVITGQSLGQSVASLAAMWSDGLVNVAGDVDWAPRDVSRIDGGMAAFGPGTIVKVPLVAGEEVMGCAVLLDSRGPRALSSEEVSALLVMASNTAVGLQHSRMFAAQRDLVARLQDVDRQKTAFMSNVSHELRTPLTSIAGYTEMLTDGDAGALTPAMESMLEAIDRNTTRLGLLLDDLLALSRIESAAFRITPTRVNVRELVDRAVEAIRPSALAADLRLEVPEAPDDLFVHGDLRQLERCLLNLLSNAVKFTPAAGSVQVRATRVLVPGALAQVWMQVSDSGIGIPATDQSNLFTRFFRASNAVEQEIPGTGLGLAIVRGIVEYHGGRMHLESQAGKGTTVTVVLPEMLPDGVVPDLGSIDGPLPKPRGEDFTPSPTL